MTDIKTRISVTAKGPSPPHPSVENRYSNAAGAEDFTKIFYQHLDASAQRPILKSFYRPTSTILWNGNAFLGGDAYVDFLIRFPATQHEVHNFDCHPVDSGMLTGAPVAGEAPSIMLVVSGSVRVGDERDKRGFSESFLLKAEEGGQVFYVANHVNRLIYKPGK
jgi:NTF2-related export protein 1/2